MTICGATGTGKTRYLIDLLEKEFMGHFNTIWLICPTFLKNETWPNWKYVQDEDFVPIACDLDDIELALTLVVRASEERGSYKDGNRNLLILNDCASSLEVKRQASLLVKEVGATVLA